MKIRSASVDELYLGAQIEHLDGRLGPWRWNVVRWVYELAVSIIRRAL